MNKSRLNKRKYRLTDTLNFGKYKDAGYEVLTLEEIINKDPDYIVWCLENLSFFDLDPDANSYFES